MKKRQIPRSVFFKWIIVSSTAIFSLIAPSDSFCEGVVGAELKLRYSWDQFLLAALMLGLLAFLFRILFKWSKSNEEASYLGNIFKDTVTEFEFKRLRVLVEQKSREGEYRREALEKGDLLDIKNRPVCPTCPPELIKFIPENRQQDGGYGGQAGRGGLGGSSGRPGSYSPGYGGDKVGYTTIDDGCNDQCMEENLKISLIYPDDKDWTEAKKDEYRHYHTLYEDYHNAVVAFNQKNSERCQNLNVAEDKYYHKALDEIREQAEKSAESVANIDLNIFRGRGPAFLLEFTAIVVIIFSAVILGILEQLEPEQIGTLLAAIAGYVLGRSKDNGNESGLTTKEKKHD